MTLIVDLGTGPRPSPRAAERPSSLFQGFDSFVTLTVRRCQASEVRPQIA